MPLASVPNPPQSLAITQPIILNNTNETSAAFIVNHVDYFAPGHGKHSHLTMIQLPNAAIPVLPVPAGGDIEIYSSPYAPTGTNELNIVKTGGVAVPFTASLQNPALEHGYTYLPSGILLKWGASDFLAASPVTVNIDPNPIVFNNIFNIQLTIVANNPAQIKDSAMNLVYNNDNNGQFFIYYTGGNFAASFVNYLIIGN